MEAERWVDKLQCGMKLLKVTFVYDFLKYKLGLYIRRQVKNIAVKEHNILKQYMIENVL